MFAALCSASLNRRGFKHIVDVDHSDFTSQALGRAREKLPASIFSQINKAVQDRHRDVTEPRIFAVDGSKVHVHPCFSKFGYKSRTNDKPVSRPAVKPICMLSSMLDSRKRTCYDSIVSSHFDERKSHLLHFDAAKRGDTLIFDRG